MRKSNFKIKAAVLAAFVLGIIASVAARHYLPLALPEGMKAWTNMLALFIQLAVSIAALLAMLFIFKIGRRD